jgi:hypothetical protein
MTYNACMTETTSKPKPWHWVACAICVAIILLPFQQFAWFFMLIDGPTAWGLVLTAVIFGFPFWVLSVLFREK